MKYLLLFFFLLSLKQIGLNGSEILTPHLALGGGYSDDRRYSGGLLQIEYLFPKFYFFRIRPEAIFISPHLNSAFLGLGIRAEIKTKHLLFTPSFIPGLYAKGKGKDLGFPLEFRSCMEIAYEFTSKFRIGLQFFHISNASLANKNPGFNSFVAILAIPLTRQGPQKRITAVR